MKIKIALLLTSITIFICVSGCDDTVVPTPLLEQAHAAYQQYVGVAPGTTRFVSSMLTTRNIPADFEENVAELQVKLGEEIARLQATSKNTVTNDLIKSLTNALMEITVINHALQNSPPTLTELPSNVAKVMRETLRAVERYHYQSIGEQTLVGIPAPVQSIPFPSQAQIEKTQQKILYEANKAALFGENIRADLLRIAAVTFGNYAQDIGTAPSQQLAPIPAATSEVASPFSEGGLLGSIAQGLRARRRFVDPDARFLPPACDNTIIDKKTCLVNPIAVVAPNDPAELISNTSGVPADLAAVGNEIISDANAAVSRFLAVPTNGPVNSTLAGNVATLEIESAKLLTYFRLIAQSPQTQKFIKELEVSQALLGVLAAILKVPSPTQPQNIPTPQLNGINLTQIPETPATPYSAQPFTDQKPPPTSLLDSVVEGVLLAEQAIHSFLGENIQQLHNFLTASNPATPDSQTITKIIEQYENTAVNADNNFEPARAALLRIVAKGFELSSANPAGLPVPTPTSIIQVPLSQAGYAAIVAQRAHQRRRDVDPNLQGYPAGCDDRTWDADTCILVP